MIKKDFMLFHIVNFLINLCRCRDGLHRSPSVSVVTIGSQFQQILYNLFQLWNGCVTNEKVWSTQEVFSVLLNMYISVSSTECLTYTTKTRFSFQTEVAEKRCW